MPADSLRIADPSVVARFLQIRSLIHDHFLVRVEKLITDRYQVQPTRRLASTLVYDQRGGFVRPGEGELWPVVFMTTVDISLALCLEITPERVSSLGTMINGPQRIRHRGWEAFWGWECPVHQVCPGFLDLDPQAQENAVAVWYGEGLDWLAGSGLIRRKS